MICDRCIHNKVCRIEYDINNCADFFELIRCEDCKYSIKKDYGGSISSINFDLYEYLCTKKSTVTHLEEHEANYFCADGERKETNG